MRNGIKENPGGYSGGFISSLRVFLRRPGIENLPPNLPVTICTLTCNSNVREFPGLVYYLEGEYNLEKLDKLSGQIKFDDQKYWFMINSRHSNGKEVNQNKIPLMPNSVISAFGLNYG